MAQNPYQLVWFQILVSLFPVPCFNVEVTENNLFREHVQVVIGLCFSLFHSLNYAIWFALLWNLLPCNRFEEQVLIWMSLVVNLEANLQNAIKWSLTCSEKSLCNRVSMELSMEERSCVDRSFSPSRVSRRYNTLSTSGEFWERVRVFAGRIAETWILEARFRLLCRMNDLQVVSCRMQLDAF